jgi:NAD-dependent deacetylase
VEKVNQLIQVIKSHHNIIALTGAGISTKAGIPDFRGDKGIYKTKGVSADKIFDITYFQTHPEYFYHFTMELLPALHDAQPTTGHKLLAKLEKMKYLKGIITQNIDGLHQKAGSKNVIEIHGSMWKFYCTSCGKRYSYDEIKEIIMKGEVPRCECGGLIKPDVVFFGEAVKYTIENKGKLIIVNKDPTPMDRYALFVFRTDIEEFAQAVLNEITES